MPHVLIGDKADDRDGLDEKLANEYGIEMISPNRSNRKVATQDGRPLRRSKRRWKVERLFAWLQHFRLPRPPCQLTRSEPEIPSDYGRYAARLTSMPRLSARFSTGVLQSSAS